MHRHGQQKEETRHGIALKAKIAATPKQDDQNMPGIVNGIGWLVR